MFCPKCGATIPDASRFCERCGATITANSAAAPNPGAPQTTVMPAGASAAAQAETETPKAKNMRLVAKIALVIALLAFFMPFVTISCDYNGKQEEIETYSGMELIVGKDYEDDDDDDRDYKNKANPYLTLGFLVTIAALVLAIKKQKTIPFVLSGISALLLIIYQASFKSFYDFDGMEYGKYITTDVKGGFVLCLLMLIASTVLLLLADMDKSPALPPPAPAKIPVNPQQTPPPVAMQTPPPMPQAAPMQTPPPAPVQAAPAPTPAENAGDPPANPQ